MSTQESLSQEAQLWARNIGGITETTVELEDGITVLAGRNATNRTSLLQAFMAALGGESASLKADAKEGAVELELDSETYTRRLRRAGNTIVTEGDPHLDDPELAELYAFLLESNPARRAVTTDADLREIIHRPVDTNEIEAEISRLTAEKNEISNELDRLESRRSGLPELERRRTQIEDQIEEKRAELEVAKDAIEEAEAEAEDQQAEQNEELEEKLTELRERRSELEDVRFDLETERESLTALREEREELEDKREELPEVESLDHDAVDEEIDRLQRRSQSIDGVVSQLQSIVQFNEEMLEGSHPEIRELLGDGDESAGQTDGAVTDQLLADEETVRCWTCGSEVKRSEIENTIERLRSLQEEKLSVRDDLEDRIESLRTERREIDQTKREYERVQERLADVENEIERRETRLEELTDRREELEDEIDSLEDEAAELEAESEPDEEDDDKESLLELNRRANEIEFSLGRLERDLETTTEEIEEIESALDDQEELEQRREEIREELEELRTRIDRIEREAVESFNEHMNTVLDILEYENINRIWIERVGETVREGRRKVEQTKFDLHIVRSTADGSTYEDTIDHLSESEREVTGLIFALAGYLVHEVYDKVPFMLLDSLEAVDSNRIADLIEYFEEYTDFLVVALLPEDAGAIDGGHDRITSI